MTTWGNVQKHMRARFRLQDDEPNMMSMVWTYEDDRSQKIIVRKYKAANRDMVEFKSAFARKGDVDPLVLLEDNSKLPLATVALSGSVYLVVYNALMDQLGTEDFDFILSRVAAVADALEEKYVRRDEF
jgi:hypothetical protein